MQNVTHVCSTVSQADRERVRLWDQRDLGIVSRFASNGQPMSDMVPASFETMLSDGDLNTTKVNDALRRQQLLRLQLDLSKVCRLHPAWDKAWTALPKKTRQDLLISSLVQTGDTGDLDDSRVHCGEHAQLAYLVDGFVTLVPQLLVDETSSGTDHE